MATTNILISGTMRNFSHGRAIYDTVSEYTVNFEVADYELVSIMQAKFLVFFNYEKREYRRCLIYGGDPSTLA
jgi:hypothetical protein